MSAVAVGWSGYFSPAASASRGISRRRRCSAASFNFPAIFIIVVVAGLLMLGTVKARRSTRSWSRSRCWRLAMFVAVALPCFNAAHFHPFMPYGFAKSGPAGAEVGVMAAAAIIFFAFYGFDAIATAAEETKNPGARSRRSASSDRWSLCVLIYMAVAGRRDRRGGLSPVRQQPRAAGADPARDRPAAAAQDPRRCRR